MKRDFYQSAQMLRFFILISVLLAFCRGQFPSPDNFGSVETSLFCQEKCVADGKGQAMLQEKCDQGGFDNFCEPDTCVCELRNRQVRIECERDTCFDAKSVRLSRVGVLRKRGVTLLYGVEATVFDKLLHKPGTCDAILSGSFKLSRQGAEIPQISDPAIERAVIKAVSEVRNSGAVICELSLQYIVQTAVAKFIRFPSTA